MADNKEKELSAQSAAATQLVAAMMQLNETLKQTAASWASVSGAVQQVTAEEQKHSAAVSEAIKKEEEFKTVTGEVMKYIENKVESATGAVKKYFEQFKNQSAPLLAIKGLAKGFSGFFSTLSSGFTILSGVVEGLFNIGVAILKIPLKIFESFIDMAGSAGSTEFAQALEDIRKEFGALNGPTASSIVTTAKNMQGFTATGLSVYRVFGNTAERLKTVAEAAAGMGPAFDQLMEDFKGAEGQAFAYQKGLGLTWEQMSIITQGAMAMGKSSESVLRDMTKISNELGDAFGINAKVISKDMGKALQDVGHFATATQKQLGQAVVYSRKLGLELSKITGLMDAFGTFEDSANAVSDLTQAIGINVDALKLMNAATPDEQLDLLRKSMAAAGKSAEDFNRFQLKAVASTLHLDEGTAKAALSMKNQGKTLEEIKKSGDKAEKKTMTQEEAMSKLADSIERLVKAGEDMKGGFFATFMKGFGIGLQQAPEFRQAIMAVRQALYATFQAGIKFGRMVMDTFPGIKKMFLGIAEAFSGQRFRNFFNEITQYFRTFFKDLSSGKHSFPELMKHLKESFFNFFNKSSPGGSKFLDGLKEAMKAISTIVAEGIKWAAGALADGLQYITDIMTGKKKLGDLGSGTEFLSQVLGPIAEALGQAAEKLGPVLKDFVLALWEKLQELWNSEDFAPIRNAIVGGSMLKMFGPAAINIGGGLIAKFFMSGAKKGIEQAAPKIAADMATAGQKIAADAPKALESGKAAMSAAVPNSSQTAALTAAGKAQIDWSGVKKFLVGFAGVVAIGLVAMGIAIAAIRTFDITTDEILKAGLLMLAIAVTMAPFVLLTKFISSIKIDEKTMNKTLLAMGVVMAEGLVAFGFALLMVSKTDMEGVKKAGIALGIIVLTMASVGLLVLEMAGIGYLVKKMEDKITAGAAAMVATIAIMITTATVIGGITAAMGVEAMKAGAELLSVISNVFVKVGEILFVAAGVGAMIVATEGIGAGLMAAGMAALVSGVGIMTTTAVGVMETLSTLKEDPNTIKLKAQAFESVMNSITNLMNAIGNILGTVKFDPTDSEAKVKAKFGGLNQFIKTLLEGENGNAGLIGVVRSIIEGLKSLKPSAIETAKAIGGILSSIASLMDGMGKSMQSLNDVVNGSGLASFLASGGEKAYNLNTVLTGAGDYIKTVTGAAIGLIKVIINALSGIPTSQLGKLKEGGEAVGSLLGAVANLLHSVAPDLSALTMETQSGGTVAGILDVGEKSKYLDMSALKAVGQQMGTMLENIGKYLPTLIDSMVTAINKVKLKPEDVKKVEGVGHLLGAVGSIMSAISSSIKQAKSTTTTDAGSKHEVGLASASVSKTSKNVQEIVSVAPKLSEIIDSIKDSLPDLIRRIVTVVASISLPPGFKEKTEAMVKLFEGISALTSMLGNMPQMGAEGTGATVELALRPLTNSIHLAQWFFKGLADNNEIGNLISWIAVVQAQIAKGSIAAVNSTTSSLTKMFDGIKNLFEKLKDFKDLSTSEGKTDFSPILAVLGAATRFLRSLATPASDTGLENLSSALSKANTAASKNNMIENAANLGRILKAVFIDGTLFKDALPKMQGMWDAGKSAEVETTISTAKILFTNLSTQGNPSSLVDLSRLITNDLSVSAAFLAKATFPDMSSLTEGLMTFVKQFENLGTIIKDSGVEPTLEAVNKIINTLNEMDVAMSKAVDVKFPARLQALAGGIGLGKKMTVRVERGEATINVDLAVVMEVGKVEKVLLSGESAIRKRINYLFDNAQKKTDDKAKTVGQDVTQYDGFSWKIGDDGSAGKMPHNY